MRMNKRKSPTREIWEDITILALGLVVLAFVISRFYLAYAMFTQLQLTIAIAPIIPILIIAIVDVLRSHRNSN